MPIEQNILGKWSFVSSENFDAYLKEAGVRLMTRKVPANLKPNLEFFREDDHIKMTLISTFKTNVSKFKIGETFDEKTADGRDVSQTYTIENDHLILTEKGVADLITLANFVFCVTMRATRFFDDFYRRYQSYYLGTWCFAQYYILEMLGILGILLITIQRHAAMCCSGSTIENVSPNCPFKNLITIILKICLTHRGVWCLLKLCTLTSTSSYLSAAKNFDAPYFSEKKKYLDNEKMSKGKIKK
uniref:FABP domain-containing protein n=1 Tax=Angiostrongylus cantonensis TaxID=6313 RepID=A0A0K0D527_ANGCA